MTALLGNRTVASDASRTATASYTSTSDSTVSHLSNYADALSSYNYNYVIEKTAVPCSTPTWIANSICFLLLVLTHPALS